MTDILKHTMAGFDLMLSSPPDGRQTAEYKRLQSLDTPCWMCHARDCNCCDDCKDVGELCDTHGWVREDGEDDIDDGYLPDESQDAYEARSFGVPRQGPI